VKINFHFFLAKLASLTAIRDSGDSKRRNNLEKTFRQVVKSRRSAAGKQREQSSGGTYQEINPSEKERTGKDKGREGMGRKESESMALKTYCHPSLNIRNNPLVASLGAFLSRILTCFASQG